ncbi:hypothetical protein CC80DRAFT_20605 [Byssothecium circinans]|uniref:F-box domain-containing protein n=1 Tax=Byssothecium circinans TaxID=147558 RepID=A0A6A5U0Y8_9PLEO|nr:hypothetical protein CC80DRAFT_20605 [Byssothecium circinans]
MPSHVKDTQLEQDREKPTCSVLALRPLPIRNIVPTTKSVLESSAPARLTALPYETLEHILLNLPMQDLLLCQRVCHCFKDMVASSRPIRRALFLEPAHYSGKLSNWKLLKWNPLLEDKLAGSLSIRVVGVHRGQEGTVKMVAHVRFEKEALLDVGWADMLFHEDASWKSMLVTQPPATLLMHPSASLFWKTSMESQAQFYHDPAGFTILDMIACSDW